MEDARYMLEEAIKSNIEALETLPVGSEEHSRLTEDLTKLYKTYNEEYKIRYETVQKEMELDIEKEKIEREIEIKQYNSEIEEKHGRINNFLKGATVIIGTALTIAGFRLEKEGYIVPKGITDNLSKFGRFLG